MPEKKNVVPRLRFPEFRNAGPWEMKKIGDIFRVTRGEVLSMKLVSESPSTETPYPVYSSQTKNNGLSGYYSDYLYEDAITWTTDGANAGNVKYRKGKFYCTNVCGVLISEDGYANSFVAELLNTVTKKHVSYVGNPKLMNGVMAQIQIPFPQIEEQQKIADCLSSLDEVIELQTKKLEALEGHKKGLMQQLFPREGETTPRLRFPEFRNAGPWEVKRLGEVCDVFQGYGFPERLQGKQQGKYPFCKVSDITNAVRNAGGHIKKAVNYVDDEDVKGLRAKPMPKGTTIFAKIGEALRLNKRAFVETECLIDNNVVGIKGRDSQAIDYFVFYFSQKIDLNKHCGGAVPSVNKYTLQSIKIVIPHLPEQQKIADCLSFLDEVIELQAKKLEALETHKQGLMQQLFPQEVG